MNRFYQVFFIMLLVIAAASCSKNDDGGNAPLRDYATQRDKDMDSINQFIDTHSMAVDADYNVTFNLISDTAPGTSIRNQTNYPLLSKIYHDSVNDVDYTIYYINMREGVDKAPSAVDSVHASYNGRLLNLTQFAIAQAPEWQTLDTTVKGWSQIFTLFKTGTYDTGGGPNPVNFNDYGAGVMFLPSFLGYYNTARTGIPVYSSLIFTFKLYELRYRDHDRDGILSKDEVDPYHSMNDYLTADTDGDGVLNMNDVDDDGDHILTKDEIHRDSSGNIIFEDCDGDGIPNYLDIDSNGKTCN